jgi:hypothetical protein
MIRARKTVALLAALVALGGCGVRPTGIIGAGALPKAAGNAATITVYLVKGDRLRAVTRPGLIGRPLLPIEQLVVQPTTNERNAGLRTEVRWPLSGTLRDGPFDVNSSQSDLYVQPAYSNRYPVSDRSPVPWSRMAKAQIACTAESISGVGRVRLTDERVWMDLTCDQFADLRS